MEQPLLRPLVRAETDAREDGWGVGQQTAPSRRGCQPDDSLPDACSGLFPGLKEGEHQKSPHRASPTG